MKIKIKVSFSARNTETLFTFSLCICYVLDTAFHKVSRFNIHCQLQIDWITRSLVNEMFQTDPSVSWMFYLHYSYRLLLQIQIFRKSAINVKQGIISFNFGNLVVSKQWFVTFATTLTNRQRVWQHDPRFSRQPANNLYNGWSCEKVSPV